MDRVQARISIQEWIDFAARCRSGQSERRRIKAQWEARVKEERVVRKVKSTKEDK